MLRRNTTSNGCRPAFMARRENMARPANSAMASVIQTTPAIGSLPVLGWLRSLSLNGAMTSPALRRSAWPASCAARTSLQRAGAISGRAAGCSVHQFGPHIVFVAIDDVGAHHVAWRQAFGTVEENRAIDFGRIAPGAPDGTLGVDLVDEDVDAPANESAVEGATHLLLHRHQSVPALLLELFGDRARQRVGGSAGDGLVFEAANACQLRLLQPGQ